MRMHLGIGPVPDVLIRRPVVLMYHGFTRGPRTDDPENLFVDVDAFAAQLDHLLDRGWHPLDLDGYLAFDRSGPWRKSFLITIDDGFESVARLAGGVLAERQVPAVLFVPADLLGDTATWLPEPADEQLLSVAELRRLLAQAPIEVGGHGADHSSMRGLPHGDLARHSVKVRQRLESVVDRPVRAFAYPFGDHDEPARQAVERAGYRIGFSVYDDAGRFAVSRVDVNGTDSLRSFRIKLTPGYRRWWRWSFPLARRAVRRFLTRGAR